jgi:hypothetical protein
VWTDADNWQFGHWLSGRAAEAPLAGTIARILDDADFLDYDSGNLTGAMQGYLIDQIASPRDMINPLEMAFFFDSIESNGKIVFRHRAREGSRSTLDVDDLVETSPENARYTLTRAQETELARAAKLTYTDPNRDYEKGSAEARMLSVASNRVAEADLPIIIDYEQAVKIAATWLHETWAARESLSLALPPSRLKLEPSDMISVTAGGMTRDYRITERSIGEALRIEAKSIEAHIYDGMEAPRREGIAKEPIVFGTPIAAFMDLPLMTGAETPYAGRLAAFSDPFGGVAFYRSPTTSGFTLNTLVNVPAILGETQTAFFSGPTSRFDLGNVLRVKLYGGELASVDDLLLFAGANMAAIENADGEWEVIQFGAASLVSTGIYDLSGLLRGQFGTEGAMRDSVAAGARFVLLDQAVVEATMVQDERALPFNWKIGPAAYDISNAAYSSVTKTFNGVGLRPLSPVHVKGARDGGGNLTISWVRRDRIGADSWDQSEIPMSEAGEAYEVDILDGSTVMRTLTATSATATYSATDQVTDFGSAQSAMSVRVYQMSQVFSRGAPRAAII